MFAITVIVVSKLKRLYTFFVTSLYLNIKTPAAMVILAAEIRFLVLDGRLSRCDITAGMMVCFELN